MKSKAPLQKPRVEPQSTDAQNKHASRDERRLKPDVIDPDAIDQDRTAEEVGSQEAELREAILDDLEVDEWDVDTKSLPEWRREELFVGEQNDILAENTVSDYSGRRFGDSDNADESADEMAERAAGHYETPEYEGEEALREAILDDLAGQEWEAETKPFSRIPREEADGGSISPDELGEHFLRRAAQQDRRVKLDETELPLVDTDATAADAADSERRVSPSRVARNDQATVAPPSHQRRANSQQGGTRNEGKRKIAR